MDRQIDQSQQPASAPSADSTPTVTQGASQNPQPVHEGISYDTKTLITVICLVFIYPIGVILMWIWMRWKWWVKLLVSLISLLLLPILGIIVASALIVINP